jgi:hypothetical protein
VDLWASGPMGGATRPPMIGWEGWRGLQRAEEGCGKAREAFAFKPYEAA